MKRRTFAIRGLILGGSLLAAVALLAGCGGGAASPGTVAQAAGATSCDNSGFYIQSKVTSDKQVIYDCRFSGGGLPKCVTYTGNIASNETELVSILFSNSVGSGKPRCLTEWKAAIARRAQAAHLAKLRKLLAELKADRHAAWHRGFSDYLPRGSTPQLPNVYYRFLPSGSYSCSSYIPHCWKLEIVTRHGCPGALSVEVEEYDGSTQVGTAYGNGGSLAPRTDVIIEADSADTGSITNGRLGSITCF